MTEKYLQGRIILESGEAEVTDRGPNSGPRGKFVDSCGLLVQFRTTSKFEGEYLRNG